VFDTQKSDRIFAVKEVNEMSEIEVVRKDHVPYQEDEEEETDESIWSALANWNKKKAEMAKKKRFAEIE
jgi:Ran GTPase-activating protein (RanGAP) involved in mRNA processing and transport